MKTLNDVNLFLLNYLCNNQLGNLKMLRLECYHMNDRIFNEDINHLISNKILKLGSLKEDPVYAVVDIDAISFSLQPLEKLGDAKVRLITTALVKNKNNYRKTAGDVGLSLDHLGKIVRKLNLKNKTHGKSIK